MVVVLVGCSPSKSSLIALSDEAAGENCANGGAKIETGLDANGDGALEASEVTKTQYVCSGVAGPNGPTGANGSSCTVAENAGTKTISCAGGTQVTISDGAKGDTGATGESCTATDNNDGTVTFTCGAMSVTVTLGSGGSGGSGHNSLIAMTADTSGTCANGGTVVQSGIDANDNDVLDASEVASTQYVFNGANGTNGDAGANGTNGTNGHNSLVILTADTTTCTTGGTRIQVGVDANDNGTLEAGEIANTRYVCNGATGGTGAPGTPGATGAAGRNSLIVMTNEAAGTNCTAGGKRIQVGVDTNGNGTLDAAEITSTQYVCNGAAAAAGTSIFGNGQDGALVVSGGTNWVTSPPNSSLQYTNITVNGAWTIPTGLKIRATGTITIAAGGSIIIPASTASGLGISSAAPQPLVNTAAWMYGGLGSQPAFARQLFNPGRFGGGVGGGANNAVDTRGAGGGTVVLLASGAISFAAGTSINANGGNGGTGTSTANSGGGGGGGVIVVMSNTSITNGGTLSVAGGKGADRIVGTPTSNPPESSPAGGGGGGLIQLAAPSITAGTLNVSAGAAGSGSSTGGFGAGGGASVGNGGASAGTGVNNGPAMPTATAGTAGAAYTTITTDPTGLFLTSTTP